MFRNEEKNRLLKKKKKYHLTFDLIYFYHKMVSVYCSRIIGIHPSGKQSKLGDKFSM